MSNNNALDFIEKVRRNRSFRKEGYAAKSPAEFAQWIFEQGYEFSPSEIDIAFRSMLLKAKDETCAEEILELRGWYSMLANAPASSTDCSMCGFRSGCGGSCP